MCSITWNCTLLAAAFSDSEPKAKPFFSVAVRQGAKIVRYTVRSVLGLYNAFCMISFRHGVQRTFGRNAANWYTLFQASQFHMMYYSSRTLPNFLALGLSESLCYQTFVDMEC